MVVLKHGVSSRPSSALRGQQQANTSSQHKTPALHMAMLSSGRLDIMIMPLPLPSRHDGATIAMCNALTAFERGRMLRQRVLVADISTVPAVCCSMSKPRLL